MGFLSHDDILRHFGNLFTEVSQMVNQTKGTAGAPCWHLSTNVFLESNLTGDLDIPLVQQNNPPGESRSFLWKLKHVNFTSNNNLRMNDLKK